MTYVAAFRTHVWDESIALLARRLANACTSSRFVVLADETNGTIDVSGYEKITHTDDARIFGLPKFPSDRLLWYNSDYPLYFLHQAFPGRDYYLLSEYDLAVNTNVDSIVRTAAERGLDLVAHKIQPSTADWYWHGHQNAAAAFSVPLRAWIFFMLVSQRALLHLLAVRQQLAGRLAASEFKGWPFCELFIPSVVNEMTDSRMGELGEFANVQNLRHRPHIRLEDERASRAGTLVHPVLGTKRYLSAVVAESRASDYFQSGSELQKALEALPFEDVVAPLRARLLWQRDYVGLALLRREMQRHKLPDDPVMADLALCKPALSSSVSPWSRSQDRAYDAAGANGDALSDDYGFHTADESEPWWMVDLSEEYVVEEVTILNRRDYSERFRRFMIESSRDSNLWTTRYAKLDDHEISADATAPWRIVFADPFLARYVRVKLCGHGTLHLRRVQVFGRALCPPAARL